MILQNFSHQRYVQKFQILKYSVELYFSKESYSIDVMDTKASRSKYRLLLPKDMIDNIIFENC